MNWAIEVASAPTSRLLFPTDLRATNTIENAHKDIAKKQNTHSDTINTRSHNSILQGEYNFIKIKSFTILFLVLLLSWLIKFSKLQSNTQKFNYSWKCTQISDKIVKYVGQSTQDIEIHGQYMFILSSDIYSLVFEVLPTRRRFFSTITQAWPKLCFLREDLFSHAVLIIFIQSYSQCFIILETLWKLHFILSSVEIGRHKKSPLQHGKVIFSPENPL